MRAGCVAAAGTVVPLGAVGAVGAVLWGVVRRAVDQWRGPVPMHVDELLTGIVAALALAVLGWCSLTYAIALLAALPGGLGRAFAWTAHRVSPVVVRRLAAATLGLGGATLIVAGPAVATTATGSTTAATAGIPQPGWAVSAPQSTLSSTSEPNATTPIPIGDRLTPPVVSRPPTPAPGWAPTRAPVRPQPASELVTGRARSAHPEGREVVVRRGQTLWGIAATHAGPGATNTEIAGLVRAWHEANRSVIGSDPDRLRPGQRLSAPVAHEGAHPGLTGTAS